MRSAIDQDPAARAGPPRTHLVGLTAIVLAVVVSIAASIVVWHHLGKRHEQEAQIHLAGHASEVALRIQERFRGYRVLLRGARAALAVAGENELAEWRTYLRRLDFKEDFPGVQGVGFSQWVRASELAAHERILRELNGEDRSVWPPGDRDERSSIVVLEPTDWRNERAIGYDMFSEPVRREAMARAVVTGEPALSGKTILVQETQTEVQAGALLYMPVFVESLPLTTEVERWAALRGWVYMPFRLATLMRNMLTQHVDEVRVQLFDRTESIEALLYDSHPGLQVGTGVFALERLDLAGHEWVLRLEALPPFLAESGQSWAELVSIVLMGGLLVGTALFLSITRSRAAQLARTTESLRRSESKYSTLVNLANDGIAATDEDFRLTFVNPGFLSLVAREEGVLLGRRLDELWGEADQSREEILASLAQGHSLRHEFRLMRGDGRQIIVLVSLAPLSDESGAMKGAIVLVSDITERKESERRIAHMATHDILTGAANRLMFAELLAHALDHARRYRHKFALLFIDLDHFKRVNDELGHHIGDRLLVEAVKRMHGSIRASDTLGRRGGDEFVVVLTEISTGNDADLVAEKIRAALERPFMLEGHEVRISSSIGIALYPDDGSDEDQLMRRADAAMYRAKMEGRNRVVHCA